ncbi:1,4-dihydroxy-2-naphthoate prenyltransferase [Actinosynnema sp. NPDC023587]|uniref:1,4-dihydroxy-2-naphthoate prenyltransferase n=1 Tax=Actinosynnema sp. NPDC023587 TaxID=3154695 RepID=UPI0033FE9418
MTAPAAPGRVRAFARPATPDIVDRHLGVLVAWALLAPDLRADGRVLATTGLVLLGAVCTFVAVVALDDVAGFRAGGDRAGGDRTTSARQALAFAGVAGTAGGALWLSAAAIAPHAPLWTLVLMGVTFALALRYSWGRKPSHRGFAEIFPVAVGSAVVLVPHGLAVGAVHAGVVVQALIFGLGPLLAAVYADTRDVGGDRRFVVALTSVEFALILSAPFAGAPWWLSPAMLPTMLLRLDQSRVGFGLGDLARARGLGVLTHRTTVAALVVVNLL